MPILVWDKAFYKKVLTFGGPIAAQQVITVGVNMMDTVMLGQLEEAVINASSLAVQVHNLFHLMCMGLSMGGSVLIARYWGAKEERSLQMTLTAVYRACLLMITIFTLAVALAPKGIMSLLTSDQAVIEEGIRYLRWTLPCYFLYGLSLTTTNVLRNCGQMRIPLYTSIGAFFVNVFFNWVFIFGHFGAPAMGIVGAALGTLISRAFEFTMNCGYLLFREKRLHFTLRTLLLPCRSILPEYVRISIPVFISDTLLGLGNSLSVSVAGHVSRGFMSAYAITTVTQQITTVFSYGVGQAALIITGNTLGEGNSKKAQEQGITFSVLGFVMGIVVGVLIVAIGPWIVNYYNILPETYEIAMELMHSVGFISIFILPGAVMSKGVLRGGGDTRFLMVADVVFLWCVSVPLGYLAGIVWNWPPFWIFFALRTDHILKVIVCFPRLKSKKWMKKISGFEKSSNGLGG